MNKQRGKVVVLILNVRSQFVFFLNVVVVVHQCEWSLVMPGTDTGWHWRGECRERVRASAPNSIFSFNDETHAQSPQQVNQVDEHAILRQINY